MQQRAVKCGALIERNIIGESVNGKRLRHIHMNLRLRIGPVDLFPILIRSLFCYIDGVVVFQCSSFFLISCLHSLRAFSI